MKNPIQLSDHFTFGRLLRFTLPSIASMIFASIYGIVDGFFVSNYVGKIPFAGLNIIMPFIMMLGAVGNMVGLSALRLLSRTRSRRQTRRREIIRLIPPTQRPFPPQGEAPR